VENKTTIRKESDFFFLRKTLTKLYPGFVIPVLPKDVLTVFDSDKLEDRKDSLQDFLNQVLVHPLLSSCKLLKYFLEDNVLILKYTNKSSKG
jgi:hypothetical protein